MGTLTWVSSDGGPHLFVASALASSWRGSLPPEAGRIVEAKFRWSAEPEALATDYDAACDVEELVGSVPIGTGYGLVLGDEVPMSTWVHSALFSGGLLVVPMEWPEPGMHEEHLLSAVSSVPAEAFAETPLSIPESAGSFILCAAADCGPNWVYPVLHVSIPGMPYRVLSAEVQAHGFWLRLHALQRAP
jgi:hypothetical protein